MTVKLTLATKKVRGTSVSFSPVSYSLFLLFVSGSCLSTIGMWKLPKLFVCSEILHPSHNILISAWLLIMTPSENMSRQHRHFSTCTSLFGRFFSRILPRHQLSGILFFFFSVFNCQWVWRGFYCWRVCEKKSLPVVVGFEPMTSNTQGKHPTRRLHSALTRMTITQHIQRTLTVGSVNTGYSHFDFF